MRFWLLHWLTPSPLGSNIQIPNRFSALTQESVGMKLTRRVVVGIIAMLTSTALAHAQQTGTLRGTVTDSAAHSAIAGVQVTIAGSQLRAVTNTSGQYVIRAVPAGAATVSANRLGYAPVQRTVRVIGGDTLTLNLAINAVSVTLAQVVSVGYGTASRHDVSSAIVSIDSTAFANTPVASIDNALQGKVAGVQVMQNSGEPGGGVSVRVRGPASLNAGNQPLYVVDGVPIIQESFDRQSPSGQNMNAITGLNPDEIASIDVLKDAAATAIYGSRGSNGVILLTTKRGALGGTKFTFSTYTGNQQVEKKLDMLNAQQYVMLENEASANDGKALRYTPGVTDSINTNWQDLVFRSAPVTNAQFAVSGGSERIRFYTSIGMFDQKGIVLGSQYRRQSGRLNLDLNATSKLLIKTSIGLTREDDDRSQGDGSLDGIVTNSLALQPFSPAYGSVFGYAGTPEGLIYSNPLALSAFNTTNYGTLRATTNIESQYRFTDRLALTGRASADVFNVSELSWRSDKIDKSAASGTGGRSSNSNTGAHKYVLEAFGNVDVLRTGSNTLSLVAGTSVEYNHADISALTGQGFPTGFTTYASNAAGITAWTGTANDHNLASFFARANWSYADKYLLSGSLRADGSSRFGSNNRYGTFPAVSAGWLVTDENWAGAIRRLGQLKLRGSFGVTGNQGIGDYSRLSLATGVAYNGASGVAISQLGNPDLKWETTKEVDAGVDYATFAGRVTVIADYYRRNTSNLLIQQPVPATSGFTSVWSNVGAIRNSGLDLSLHTINVKTKRFGWNSDFNITWNKNEVTALYGGRNIPTTFGGRQVAIVAVGQPVGEFYMYKYLRVDPATGNAVYAKSGGGETLAPTTADLFTVGSPQPKYYGGFTNTVTVGNFDLRGFLQFNQGSKVFNLVRIFSDDGGRSGDNKIAQLMNRWQKPGDITDVPRMSVGGLSGARVISSRLLQDASFVRLGDVTLGYALPKSLAARTGLHDTRLYVAGHNLKTWTKYIGYNPDVNSGGSGANVVTGLDYYAYPLSRTFTFGITTTWGAK
jgi:TonB-linked SusC/RagA family outer membrane protein